MLITLCYSVLTWMQSRQRTEIVGWIQECLVKEKGSVVFIRDRILLASPRKGISPTLDNLLEQSFMSQSSSGYGLSSSVNRSESFSSGGDPLSNSPSRNLSRSSSNVSGGSNYSTPRKEHVGAGSAGASGSGQYDGEIHLSVMSTKSNSRSSSNATHFGSIRQISDLCYNHSSVRLKRLLWEEDRARAIVLMPQQIVDLHDWTAFVDSELEMSSHSQIDVRKFYILLEAEPGMTQRAYYRKFTQFGRIVSWKCGPTDLALILYSDLNQLIELMHIFRLGQIVLEGGWRVYRLTTTNIEGAVGTLISRGDLAGKASLTPADLRRISAGLYESRTPYTTADNSTAASVTGTPKTFVSVSDSQDISKHDITTIDEETFEDSELDLTVTKLPNWFERSPRKRSVANISFTEKTPIHQGPRRKSFCPGSLGSLPNKSSSLASLLLCTKSLSLDEDEPPSRRNTESEGRSRTLPPNSLRTSGVSARSADSLTKTSSKTPSSSGAGTPSHLLSPMTNTDYSLGSPGVQSAGTSPRRVPRKSPKRIGKPPNILILCENEAKRSEIGIVLKAMLANDRYAIYDIRWDQLGVGPTMIDLAEQTALLVLAGNVPDNGASHILQFLGDGGRLLSWCCESPPFGPSEIQNSSASNTMKKIIQHGPAQKLTHPLVTSNRLWGPAGDNQPPPGFQRVLETNDSEGYSRPMTVSVYGRVKDTNQSCIVQLDGGALGGKAILSQIHFEKCVDENDSLALLSLLLSQNLNIDCTQIKAPEYTIGYLLGDHKKVVDFLTSNPSTVQQVDLTVDFIPRGEKGSLPSHLRFPIRVLECPQNFSTVEYYENLTTKELGRLVVYTDVITSTMNVINGHFLGHGFVVIAGRQTSGRGRGKNVWLSPEGCACFSIQLSVDLDSAMGRRISLLQHIMGLAIVLSIPNHKEIGLCVKWPNDIYVNDVKIGGILVESQIQDRKITVNIGVGINVTNAYPTVSLNSILQENANAPVASTSKAVPLPKGKKDKPILSIEKVIARSLSELENLVELMESNAIEKIINLYTDNWIHGSVDSDDNIVSVEVTGGNFAECRVIGIDQFGFLRVRENNSGHVFSVRPDGNSFDIANKLIAIKG